jgi:hypothetical protein
MKSAAFGGLAMMMLMGCSGLNQPTDQVTAAPKRELLSAEKAALGPVFAAGLKDPAAAQFRWMPVVLTERDGITDYCGLVNGRNSYGGYTGFVRFYAHLRKDDKGQFTRATLREVEQPGREINPLDPRWLNGICEKFGYDDFSMAR